MNARRTKKTTDDLHRPELEAVVLGSLMVYGDEAVLALADTGLTAKDFRHEAQQDFYKLLHKRIEDGKPVSPRLLIAALDNDDLARFGGTDALEHTLPHQASLAHLVWAADIVRALAMLRRGADFGRWMQDKALAHIPDGDIVAFAEQFTAAAEENACRLRDATVAQKFVHIAKPVNEWLQDMERKLAGEVVEAPLSTGLDELDRLTNGGLYAADLAVLAGRPAMGKTSAGMTLASNISHDGHGVGIVSVEQPAVQVSCKLASIESSITYGKFRAKEFYDDAELGRALQGMRDVAELPIHINEAAYRWTEIRSQIRRLKLTMARTDTPLKVVVIDYLGLVENDEVDANRQEQTDKIINGSKHLAKELGIAIVVLVQINREAVKGKGEVPELHHLRSSGAIENAADLAILIHRRGYYHKEHPQSEAMWRVQKNRHGETQDLDIHWHGPTGTFSNADFSASTHHPSADEGGYR